MTDSTEFARVTFFVIVLFAKHSEPAPCIKDGNRMLMKTARS